MDRLETLDKLIVVVPPAPPLGLGFDIFATLTLATLVLGGATVLIVILVCVLALWAGLCPFCCTPFPLLRAIWSICNDWNCCIPPLLLV